jgi:hypothetical protein
MNKIRRNANTNAARRISGQLYLPAVLGDESGNIAGSIPGRVLVRRQSSNPDVLFPSEEVLAPQGKQLTWSPGDPIELEYDSKKRLRIKGPDTDEMLSIGVDPIGVALQQNSPRITQGSIETLSVVPLGGLVLGIKAWNVIIGNTYYEFGGGNIDLATAGTGSTSLVPDAGYQRYVVIFVEDDYETIDVQASTQSLIGEATPVSDDIQECLDAEASLTANATSVFAVKLVGDQTQITQNGLEVDGRDLRQMVNTAASSSASLSFQPDVITTVVVIPANCQGNYREEVVIEDGGDW